MSLNRYRLRHLVKSGHKGATNAAKLLEQPEQLIGLILLGNNFVNILASSIATIIALRLLGEAGIAIATGLLTLVILIFAEVTPKTLATQRTEAIAFFAARVYTPLLRWVYPLVWVVNIISSGLLRLMRLNNHDSTDIGLNREELRTILNESGGLIPRRHQEMLVNLLDLEQASVLDIMVPYNEITSIDLHDDWESIEQQLANTPHGRIPVYDGGVENIIGILHQRKLIALPSQVTIDKELIRSRMRTPYFIPEGTSLTRQLLNFQRDKRRIGLVVDEYGDLLGLVTLEDILEEVVGEFTSDPSNDRGLHPDNDGGYIAKGSTQVRTLNRKLGWQLHSSGPKTLNGLILEQMESIPTTGITFVMEGYPVEVLETQGNAVKRVRIGPKLPLGKGVALNNPLNPENEE